MVAPVWIHSFQATCVEIVTSVVRVLPACRVEPEGLPGSAPAGPGIVFFTSVTDALVAFVREASRQGRERVIAVQVDPSAPGACGAWRLLEAGASDLVRWRGETRTCADLRARFERWARVDELIRSPLVKNNLVGESPAWTTVLRQIAEVAAFSGAAVLLQGETGTGKELLARLIHTLDPRPRHGELVVVDCANIVPALAGSEFFGHERGAFTGAVAARDGAFALADGGTLFLDEVGELPLELQAQILRVIQEQKFKRVGGNAWRETQFRLVCATHRDLIECVARGSFRPDLFYRIASITCHLPPLRERSEDILRLARFFLRENRQDGEPPDLDPAVRELLLAREYPGNVRELRQFVARLASRHVGNGPITPGDVPAEERPRTAEWNGDWRAAGFEQAIGRAVARGVPLRDIARAAADTAIRVALREEGSVKAAAHRLGVTDRALQLRRKPRPSRGNPSGMGNGRSADGRNGGEA